MEINFERALEKELEKNNFGYSRIEGFHEFGSAFDPVWYKQGIIYRKRDEFLGPISNFPKLVFCTTNEEISLKEKDGQLYTNPRMINFLLDNKVKRLCAWDGGTSLDYGVMSSNNGGIFDVDTLRF